MARPPKPSFVVFSPVGLNLLSTYIKLEKSHWITRWFGDIYFEVRSDVCLIPIYLLLQWNLLMSNLQIILINPKINFSQSSWRWWLLKITFLFIICAWAILWTYATSLETPLGKLNFPRLYDVIHFSIFLSPTILSQEGCQPMRKNFSFILIPVILLKRLNSLTQLNSMKASWSGIKY